MGKIMVFLILLFSAIGVCLAQSQYGIGNPNPGDSSIAAASATAGPSGIVTSNNENETGNSQDNTDTGNVAQ